MTAILNLFKLHIYLYNRRESMYVTAPNTKEASNQNMILCYCIGGSILFLAGGGTCGAIIGHNLQSTLEGAGIGIGAAVCILLVAYGISRRYQQDDNKEDYNYQASENNNGLNN